MLQAIADFLGQLSAAARVMAGVGLLMVVAGVMMLGRIRRLVSAAEAEAAGREDDDRLGGRGRETGDGAGGADRDVNRSVWVFTRTAAAFALAVLGYHLFVWGLPAGMTELCVPVRLWFVVPVACAAMVAGAWSMERNGM